MIKKIAEIKNQGYLNHSQVIVAISRNTIFFGFNGSGKSTFSGELEKIQYETDRQNNPFYIATEINIS